MEKTLGGDRLGSGNNQKVYMHNFGMNSFNLSQDWKSTMAPGVLYPFLKCVGTNHGTFDIDLDTFVRTLPTNGPLFGSFKMQLDLFSVPFRLYQGILHNNPINLGMNMDRVYLPKIYVSTIDGKDAPRPEGADDYNYQINESSLLKYLGISGIGHASDYQTQENPYVIGRKFNAIPALAYYDIFKCYYSNKQEENAYVITPGAISDAGLNAIKIAAYRPDNYPNVPWHKVISSRNNGEIEENLFRLPTGQYQWEIRIWIKENVTNDITLKQGILEYTNIKFYGGDTDEESLENIVGDTTCTQTWYDQGEEGTILVISGTDASEFLTYNADWNGNISIDLNYQDITTEKYTSSIKLTQFKLSNIDKMRERLLTANTLGDEVIIKIESDGSLNIQPYYTLVGRNNGTNIGYNAFKMNGLVVKTYQSDQFNNWLNSDFVDSISSLTSVDTSGGSFTMDSLNLAEKVYELLNRILVAGGTYQDWQEAVYGEGAIRMCETPMYIGGMSSEIMFEEVIATNDNQTERQALGSLGGKGTQVGRKGGQNIHVKIDEPGYIIGIASLTPRICYNQGNDWDMTELDTINDLHKPSLDGIGFQDLMVEQFAWWNTIVGGTTYHETITRDAAGKQTAWLNYQTAVDKCFGDFANDTNGYMVLSRRYEKGATFKDVKDITTYIDPQKFNYAFAYSKLDAQNFWAQIVSKVTARRKMGAQQLPNL